MYAVLGLRERSAGRQCGVFGVRGLPVRAIVREEKRAQRLLHEGCEIALSDVRDVQELVAALRGVKRLLVVCPTNPRAENAEEDMRSQIAAISVAIDFQRKVGARTTRPELDKSGGKGPSILARPASS